MDQLYGDIAVAPHTHGVDLLSPNDGFTGVNALDLQLVPTVPVKHTYHLHVTDNYFRLKGKERGPGFQNINIFVTRLLACYSIIVIHETICFVLFSCILQFSLVLPPSLLHLPNLLFFSLCFPSLLFYSSIIQHVLIYSNLGPLYSTPANLPHPFPPSKSLLAPAYSSDRPCHKCINKNNSSSKIHSTSLHSTPTQFSYLLFSSLLFSSYLFSSLFL